MYAVNPRFMSRDYACVREVVNGYEISCAFWKPEHQLSGELFRNELRVYDSQGDDVTEQVFGQRDGVDATIPNLMRAYVWCSEQEVQDGRG